MQYLKKILMLISGAVYVLGGLTSLPAQAAQPMTVNLQFMNHIQANLPEQDVFIQKDGFPADQVFRVEGTAAGDPTNLAKTAFATASSTPHDPFKVGINPLGPYAKGKDLGFTLQKWLAATGSGTYRVTDNNTAELKLNFTNLVPGGTYTVWCSRLKFPPNPSVVDMPCGASDGSQNVFHSDSSGNGSFNLTLPPLLDSTDTTKTVVVIAYHSDGQTHGGNPGDFGSATHVQLFSMLPAPNASAPVIQSCIADAVGKRDAAIISAVDAYHTAVVSALQTRTTALQTALNMTDAKAKRAALRAAVRNYTNSITQARRNLQTARQSAWRQFRADKRACGRAGLDDTTNEGLDTRL